MSGLKAIAATGTRLEVLKALRDKLAGAIDEAPPAVMSPLSKQFSDVLEQIDSLTPVSIKDTPLDELRKRRADRQSNPKSAVAASRGRK